MCVDNVGASGDFESGLQLDRQTLFLTKPL